MFEMGIGTESAQLYMDWTLILEKYRRNFDAACLVYQQGLQRVKKES